MALRLEFRQPYNDKTEMVVTPSVVAEVRRRWVSKEYKSEEQQQFIENVMKIHYSPEEVYCLHRYAVGKTFPIGKTSMGYIMSCSQCGHTYPTDIYPQETL